MQNLMPLLIVPFIAALLAFICPNIHTRHFKKLALLLSLLPLAILVYGHHEMIGSVIQYPWFPAASIEFYLKVDSLSLVFLYLVAIIVPISLIPVKSASLTLPNVFYGLVLLLQGLLMGFFMARDLALFTFFFESILIPLYFMISLWGGPQRQSAALKFLIYMIAGSTLMVAAVLALYMASGTFNLDTLAGTMANVPHTAVLGAIFFLAFAVKTPLFPFHAWLPDAYYQASTTGTILLSAVLSKAGVYGFLRVVLELFPDFVQTYQFLFIGFAIAGVLYGAFAAWMQTDYKRLIAYSSFSHVNFILVGLFTLVQAGEMGAILQALNHAVTITALFLMTDWLESRINSTALSQTGGLAKYMPHLCWLTLFFVLASVALPGTNNFVGEIFIFYGLFGKSFWLTFILGLSIIFSVVYMLRFMQKIYFETPRPVEESWKDIKGKQFALALPLIVLTLWLGIYPTPVIKILEPAAEKISAIATLEEHQ